MTGKEVVNLIQKLEAEGMSAEKIIEIIKYVETAELKQKLNNKTVKFSGISKKFYTAWPKVKLRRNIFSVCKFPCGIK